MFLFISPNHPYASAISVAFFVFSFWGVGFSPSLPKDLLQHIPNLGRISMGPLLIDPLHLVVPTLLLLFYSCYALLSAAMAGAAMLERQGGAAVPSLTSEELKLFVEQLPIERWLCSESLGKLSGRELRDRLRQRRAEPRGALEREDMVSALQSAPHESLCSICHDELEDGVEVRLLPCCHYFHVQCVDRWLCDASRAPSCPLCNTRLDVSGVARTRRENGDAGLHAVVDDHLAPGGRVAVGIGHGIGGMIDGLLRVWWQ